MRYRRFLLLLLVLLLLPLLLPLFPLPRLHFVYLPSALAPLSLHRYFPPHHASASAAVAMRVHDEPRVVRVPRLPQRRPLPQALHLAVLSVRPRAMGPFDASA